MLWAFKAWWIICCQGKWKHKNAKNYSTFCLCCSAFILQVSRRLPQPETSRRCYTGASAAIQGVVNDLQLLNIIRLGSSCYTEAERYIVQKIHKHYECLFLPPHSHVFDQTLEVLSLFVTDFFSFLRRINDVEFLIFFFMKSAC